MFESRTGGLSEQASHHREEEAKIELTKEQGWHSEQELVELGWSKPGSHLLSTALEIYNYEGQR